MGRVRAARAERARDQVVARRLAGPRLRQASQQREQHRPPRERHEPLSAPRRPTAAVDDQVRRRQHRLDLGQRQGPRLVRRRPGARPAGPGPGPPARPPRRARRCRTAPTACRARARAARAGSARPRRSAISKVTRSAMAARRAGSSPRASVAQAPSASSIRPSSKRRRICSSRAWAGVLPIAVSGERAQRLGQRPGRPGEIARRQRHLRLRREAARALDRLARSEAPRRPSQQLARPCAGHRAGPSRSRAARAPPGRPAGRRA